jgi:hypothetical protein
MARFIQCKSVGPGGTRCTKRVAHRTDHKDDEGNEWSEAQAVKCGAYPSHDGRWPCVLPKGHRSLRHRNAIGGMWDHAASAAIAAEPKPAKADAFANLAASLGTAPLDALTGIVRDEIPEATSVTVGRKWRKSAGNLWSLEVCTSKSSCSLESESFSEALRFAKIAHGK